jgi:hypothetical protein
MSSLVKHFFNKSGAVVDYQQRVNDIHVIDRKWNIFTEVKYNNFSKWSKCVHFCNVCPYLTISINFLPGKSAGQVCRASLPGKSAGQVCRASLPGKSAGQVCRASLPGSKSTVGKNCAKFDF